MDQPAGQVDRAFPCRVPTSPVRFGSGRRDVVLNLYAGTGSNHYALSHEGDEQNKIFDVAVRGIDGIGGSRAFPGIGLCHNIGAGSTRLLWDAERGV